MIKAVVFDLDNTLMDFMKMKKRAIEEAIPAMVDAGLEITPEVANRIIDEIYKEQGIEYQQVFDEFLNRVLKKVDYKILSAGICFVKCFPPVTNAIYPFLHETGKLFRSTSSSCEIK